MSITYCNCTECLKLRKLVTGAYRRLESALLGYEGASSTFQGGDRELFEALEREAFKDVGRKT